MATSTTPQPYTADRPENSTTSVDANRLKKKPSHGLPVSIGDPNGTKFAFSMLEAAQLESANSRTVVRVWQSWETGFSRWQARQVRSPWQSKYRTDL